MSDILEYKCPNCGGTVNFDTSTQKMKCPFCDTEFDVSEVEQPNNEASDEMQWDTDTGTRWQEGEDGNMSVFTCKSCGGEIVGDENTVSSTCPYCGNAVVMSGRISGMLKPDYIIPFKLDKKAAKEKLKSYVNSKKLAPNTFKSENRLEEIKGVYVPFWLFDSNINASINYEGTRVRTWRDNDYEYTETSFYDVYRQGNMSFMNIPVDGSNKMPDDLMESIEPYDFSEAVDFKSAYLAGYLADKYDVDMQASIPRANQRIKESAADTLGNTVQGYTSLIPRVTNVQLINGVSKYALFPVWLLKTKYKDQNYTFAMNGQTGKIIGNLPVDNGKLIGIFSGIAAVISVIAYGVVNLLGLFQEVLK